MPTSCSIVAPWSVIPLIRHWPSFHAAVAIEPDLEQMPAYDHLFYGYLRLGLRPQADTTLKYRVSIPLSGEPRMRSGGSSSGSPMTRGSTPGGNLWRHGGSALAWTRRLWTG